MMKWFRESQLDPLAVSMSGVKLGDRLLVVGCTDPQLIAALAMKAGLTGRACVVDDSAERATSAGAAVRREGALVETATSPGGALPFEDGSFDIVVVRDVIAKASAADRSSRAREALRVLRPGGRCLVVDGSKQGLLGSLFSSGVGDPEYRSSGGAQRVLEAAGFAAVRTLAEREGQVFVEGLKKNA